MTNDTKQTMLKQPILSRQDCNRRAGTATALTVLCLWGLAIFSPPRASAQDIELSVGIEQRFGDESTDELTLEAPPGDRLSLRFLSGDMEPQTLQADSVTVEIAMQAPSEAQVEEWIVLSDRATFETAEDSAQQWRSRGIEVEVVQPGRWQVWAKRDVYQTPLLRRLLLQSLRAKGNNTAYLKTQILEQVPRLSFVVDGYRYNRRRLEITAENNRIQVSQGEQKQNPRLYAGSLKLQPNAYGNYTLVNQVTLETYLRGVVPHEIGAGAPYAAVEAQTIIARTYALRNLRRFAADNYQLCADTHCQVYRGLTGTVPQADRAIAATEGLVLTYNNELVDALYSSTSGGVTAPFSDTWDGSERPYLKAIVDAPVPVWNLSQKSLSDEQNFRQFIDMEEGFNETGRNTFRWRRQATLEEIEAALQRYLERTNHPLADLSNIEQMQVVERSPAGRILKLVVQTDKGAIEIHKNEVRSAFIPPRSTLFYLEPIYGADETLKGYAFVGGGFGHGVGLSQYGSYNLAQLGWSAQQILDFYYPGTQVQPLNDALVFWKEPTIPQTPIFSPSSP